MRTPSRATILVLLLAVLGACGGMTPVKPAPDMAVTPTPTPTRNNDCYDEADVRSLCTSHAACTAHFTSGLHLCAQGGISWTVGDNLACSGGLTSLVTVPEQMRIFFSTSGGIMGAAQPRCGMSFGTVGTGCSDGKSGDVFYCF